MDRPVKLLERLELSSCSSVFKIKLSSLARFGRLEHRILAGELLQPHRPWPWRTGPSHHAASHVSKLHSTYTSMKILRANDLAGHRPKFVSRANERRDRHRPRIGEELGHLGDPPDVFPPVVVRETKVKLFKPVRMLSPSSTWVKKPSPCSRRSSALAKVLLPLPDKPYSQTTKPRCFSNVSLALRPSSCPNVG